MNNLETIGSLYCDFQRLRQEYANLMELLQRAKNGEVTLAQIQLDHKAQTWALALTEQPLPEPASE